MPKTNEMEIVIETKFYTKAEQIIEFILIKKKLQEIGCILQKGANIYTRKLHYIIRLNKTLRKEMKRNISGYKQIKAR